MNENLNEMLIPDDCRGTRQTDHGISIPGMTVHFRNLETALGGYIRQADIVLGCAAWLTSEPILAALAGVPDGVALVVQKEDFLRPDTRQQGAAFRRRLQRQYGLLTEILEGRAAYGLGVLDSMNNYVGCETGPIRCVGNHNRDRHPSFPRMHNKFFVFCRSNDNDDDEDYIIPYAVWTGSMNPTYNATQSFENAVYIENQTVAAAYRDEFAQIMAFSEPLDWTSDWCAPEWRIGT